ncbi:hypothetical protein GCK72_022806 [Caenorhabditis remanei]|uniref:C2H2-type domain-containing protein n=1 Tax=Caenorhabditis remanei TaxID=31234 RepID=A0A6A5FUY4_CAERE|nr:hypothetical protein GCK72_022806 [Caenorhabditis remanei]KAF1746353.1 hypothetical protein GCK72_022806 [Caenorhabditis remanei]
MPFNHFSLAHQSLSRSGYPFAVTHGGNKSLAITSTSESLCAETHPITTPVHCFGEYQYDDARQYENLLRSLSLPKLKIRETDFEINPPTRTYFDLDEQVEHEYPVILPANNNCHSVRNLSGSPTLLGNDEEVPQNKDVESSQLSSLAVLPTFKKRPMFNALGTKARAHSGEQPVSLSIFVEESGMNKHELAHTETKKFHCNFCPTICSSNSNLKRHLNRKHSTKEPFQCEICGHTFAIKGEMNRHKKIHLPSGYMITCRTCNQPFKNSFRLRNHQMKSTCHVEDGTLMEVKEFVNKLEPMVSPIKGQATSERNQPQTGDWELVVTEYCGSTET